MHADYDHHSLDLREREREREKERESEIKVHCNNIDKQIFA